MAGRWGAMRYLATVGTRVCIFREWHTTVGICGPVDAVGENVVWAERGSSTTHKYITEHALGHLDVAFADYTAKRG